MVVNDHQDDWDYHLLDVQVAYSNSVNATTSLAPSQLYLWLNASLLLAGIEREKYSRYGSPARDYSTYHDLLRNHQKCTYDLVRKHHAFTTSRIARANDGSRTVLVLRPI